MKSKKKMYKMFFVIMIAVLMIGYMIIMPKSKEINEKSIQDNIVELVKEKDIITMTDCSTRLKAVASLARFCEFS